jgi:hypothetical protein
MSVISNVWTRMSELSRNINALVTTHTITTVYRTVGTPTVNEPKSSDDIVIDIPYDPSGGISGTAGISAASGGTVPGQGDSDTVPAMLTPGEFVVRKSAVQTFGENFFHMINGSVKGFMKGGLVQRFATGGPVENIVPTDPSYISYVFEIFTDSIVKVKDLLINMKAEIDRKKGGNYLRPESSYLAKGGLVGGSGNSNHVSPMLAMVNSMRNFTVPKFAMGGVVPSFASGGSVKGNEVITLNLQLGKTNVPLQVVGNTATMRQNVKMLEKELARMRLSHG